MPETDKDALRILLRRFGLRADKRLGQNFLADSAILADISAAAQICPSDQILEIGPGLGGLTECLLKSGCRRLVAVEIDRRFKPRLDELSAQYPNLTVIYQDILKADIAGLTDGQPFKTVANLPYYITTPVLMRFMESDLPFERLVVMVQSEVAGRMASPPGGRVYGALSVAAQYYTEVELLFKVPSAAFIPPPEVESAVVVCRRRETAPVDIDDKSLFFQIVRAAFAQRRKILANSLKNMGLTAEQTAGWLRLSGIDGQRRAETLSLDDFAQLTNSFAQWR